MKLPALNLSSLSELFLKHGEKGAVAIVGLVGLWLAWGAIDAVRSLSVTQAQTPQAVEQAASQARAHIDRDAQPPVDLLPARTPLADLIDPWRTPLVPWKSGSAPWLAIATPPTLPLLDNPLFAEAAKRGKPEVLPIEDLRAVAGIAILAPLAAAQDGRPAPPPVAQPAKPKPAEPPRGRRPPQGADPLGGGGELAPSPEAMAAQGPAQPDGRVQPYVIVTGLIPVAKQQAEYRSRFDGCGFRDPKRDSPLWCDFEIERSSVAADGKESWTKIDLAAVAKKLVAEGVAVAVGGDLAEFQLGSGEDARNPPTTPLPFCSALPQRIDDTWELGDLHPWFVERLVERLAKAAGQEAMPREAVNPLPGREGPDFGGAEGRGPDPIVAEAKPDLPAYRMFRFIDTDVRPGGSYRYRVRLKVWNPNYHKNPDEMRPHLTDPSLALETKIASAESKPSPLASVPETTRIVVAPLRRGEIKDLRLRPGTYEILVVAPRDPSNPLDASALRGLVGDPGVEINVDEKLNLKNQKDRARGLSIKTERVLVDARGRQEDRRDGPAEKEKPPGVIPEPLDVLVMRKNGTFDLVTTADSERAVSAYLNTLPRRGSKADAVDPAAGGANSSELPAADPLGGRGGR